MADFTPTVKFTLVTNNVGFFNQDTKTFEQIEVQDIINNKSIEFITLGKTAIPEIEKNENSVTIKRLFNTEESAQEWSAFLENIYNTYPNLAPYCHSKTIELI